MSECLGVVIDFNPESSSGVVKSKSGRIFTVLSTDIQSMTVGPSTWECLKVGQQVKFDKSGSRAVNVIRIKASSV